MQHRLGSRTRSRILIVLAGGLVSAAAILAACSTDNGSTPVPSIDSGRADTSTGTDGSNNNTDGNTPLDGGADCANVPETKSSVGPYCFSVADAGPDGSSKSKNCNSAADEICCSGGSLGSDAGFEPSTCKAPGTNASGGYNEGTCGFANPGGQEWHCTEKSHCPGQDELCCLIGSDAGSPKPGNNFDFPGCQAYFQSTTFTNGSRCRKTSCQAGEQTLCASDADCKSGKCVPLKVAGRFTGYCRVNL